MMFQIIDLGWKSGLIASAGLVMGAMMRGRPAALRATMLRSAVITLLLLPLLSAFLPAMSLNWLPALPASIPNLTADLGSSAARSSLGAPYSFAVVGIATLTIYLAVVALLLVRLAIGVWTLRRWTCDATQSVDPCWLREIERRSASIGRPLYLRVSRLANAPFSWGAGWIVIDPNTEAQRERAASVLAHEAAHIRRGDWGGLVMCRIVTALFWFNPLVWLLTRALIQDMELAADAEALCDVARADYAQALLSIALSGQGPAAANGMATGSAFAQRIAACLAGRGTRSPSRFVQTILLACAIGAAGPIAAVKFVPVQVSSRAASIGFHDPSDTRDARRKWGVPHDALRSLGLAIHRLTDN